jgi:hypothetical protein
MCCSKEAVMLEQLRPCLAQLQKLLVKVNPRANQFCKNICKYLSFPLLSSPLTTPIWRDAPSLPTLLPP